MDILRLQNQLKDGEDFEQKWITRGEERRGGRGEEEGGERHREIETRN